MKEMVQEAGALAAHAHRGQVDKAGRPYIDHVRAVEGMMPTRDYDGRTVALLHDVVEDTDWTIEQLRDVGFPENVLEAVEAITHRKAEPYPEYIERIAQNELATRVKLADLREHLRPGYEDVIPKSLSDKYKRCIARLEQ